ncbi:MAG: cytochrome-c oxidase, cbb3-type subunit III [Gammaproteobacteria bacterium]|nr:cytochrome-c oxidase, cbb3-type subunit III [Gammaproteobacteria bacterium]
MSTALSWFIIIFTLANIIGCYVLIRWSSKPIPGESKTGEVTGHTWDENLQELNNPLPRWWLWLFYITIIFGLIYGAIYPTFGNFKGVANWSQEQRYEQEVADADKKYGPIFAAYSKQSIPDLAKNPKAMQAGQRLFLNYCATCHGSDARGYTGFPNLRDSDWLYGGSPEAIKASIMNGRSGIMPPMGAALGDDGVKAVTAYILSLSRGGQDASVVAIGKSKYQSLCVGCHQANAKGNVAIGAPNLTDDTWLHGRSAGAIKQSIANGRTGVMPAHGNFLGKDKVHLLSAYVYSLSNK